VKPKSTRKNSSADVLRKIDVSDADAFELAMADVVRLPEDPRGRIRERPPASAPPAASAGDRVDDPVEDFAAPGVDRREIRKLKRGAYGVGDRRDLHGLTVAEACASVGRFIDNSRHARCRCVCIVHGRGVHSEGQTSVLKARVRECLRRHRSVLAYADAPPSDGGAGAVYVLLRK
jgi:DNA-nicking Smr family endonuclease